MQDMNKPIQHCSVIRFVSQCTPNGKQSYGYHHQHCEGQSGCGIHPASARKTIEDAARELRRLNGERAITMGFTKFFTHTQSYGPMTATGQAYLGSSKNTEVKI